jgi:hypothetical protein
MWHEVVDADAHEDLRLLQEATRRAEFITLVY